MTHPRQSVGSVAMYAVGMLLRGGVPPLIRASAEHAVRARSSNHEAAVPRGIPAAAGPDIADITRRNRRSSVVYGRTHRTSPRPPLRRCAEGGEFLPAQAGGPPVLGPPPSTRASPSSSVALLLTAPRSGCSRPTPVRGRSRWACMPCQQGAGGGWLARRASPWTCAFQCRPKEPGPPPASQVYSSAPLAAHLAKTKEERAIAFKRLAQMTLSETSHAHT